MIFLQKILNLVNRHIDTRNNTSDDRTITIINIKVKALLNYLQIITQEYEHYVSSYQIQKSILSGDKADLLLLV